jgi:hypothetical protein
MNRLKTTSIVLIVLGIILFLVGFQFKIMHWPNDMYKGIISGPIVFVIGLILLLIYQSKQSNK